MTLHPAIGGNRGNSFCGPAALSSVFCISTSDAAAVIRDISGKAKIFGVHNWQLTGAMHSLGASFVEVTPKGTRSRLEDFARNIEPGTYIVNVTGHYVALDTTTMEVCDNHTIYPLALARYSKRRKCVKTSWRITSITPRVNYTHAKTDAMALALLLNARIKVSEQQRSLTLNIHAPAGKHWHDGAVHVMYIEGNAPTTPERNEVWLDALSRMQCGLEDCDVEHNQDCADNAEEN